MNCIYKFIHFNNKNLSIPNFFDLKKVINLSTSKKKKSNYQILSFLIETTLSMGKTKSFCFTISDTTSFLFLPGMFRYNSLLKSHHVFRKIIANLGYQWSAHKNHNGIHCHFSYAKWISISRKNLRGCQRKFPHSFIRN